MIKHYAIFVLACLFFSFKNGRSQDMLLSLNSGISSTKVRGSEIHAVSESLNALVINLNMQYYFSERVFGILGVGLEKKGMETMIPLTDVNGGVVGELKSVNTFNYFTLPVLFCYEIGNRYKYHIGTGGYLNILTKHEYELDAYNTFPGSKESKIDNYKKLDFGIPVRLGISHLFNDNWGVSFIFQNSFGLINVVEVEIDGSKALKFNSMYAMFGLKYKLN